MSDFYSSGILGGPIDGKARMAAEYPKVEAKTNLYVLHRSSGFRGEVVRIEHDGAVVLRSRSSSAERLFSMTPGAFAVDGETVTLIRPRVAKSKSSATASGSVAPVDTKAKVAKASRIWVEGVHDAELIEKVWGDDLRAEGIVVERLDGIDVLADRIAEFGPNRRARLGVLVDHLVTGSKEQRIAAAVSGPDVTVLGTPYVDVWQAIRPAALGITAWPVIPMGQDWKTGICRSFGESDPRVFWKKLLGRVHSYADLEPSLVGAVESLIDFVTEPI